MQHTQPSAAESTIPSLMDRSIAAFYRNLPELLISHPAKWVAYHGDDFMGAGRTETELYEQCLRKGLNEGDFIVLFADEAARWDHEEIELPLNQGLAKSCTVTLTRV